MPFKTSRTIQFGDCDPAGFIYTPRIAHFVVEAALEFLTHVLGGSAARQLISMGVLPPARSLSIDFLKPLTWDDLIDIEAIVGEIRTQSFSILLTARTENNDTAFRATLVQVSVSPQTKRAVPLPARLRAALVLSRNDQSPRVRAL